SRIVTFSLFIFSSHTPHSPPSAPSSSYLDPLSLHDALPISLAVIDSPYSDNVVYSPDSRCLGRISCRDARFYEEMEKVASRHEIDRKSTRLNSSHEWISYAVFCLKKKKKKTR